jgi:hypothetical protein
MRTGEADAKAGNASVSGRLNPYLIVGGGELAPIGLDHFVLHQHARLGSGANHTLDTRFGGRLSTEAV